MDNKSITIKTPGKLMIAGEFAVLEPHQQLAALAVDRFVYVTIKGSNENKLCLHDLGLENLSFSMNRTSLQIDTKDSRVRYVRDAMEIVFRYLQEQQIHITPFQLEIKSELDDQSGIKYGLGSSAAVVTGVVTAMLTTFLPENPEKMLIFKLAALSHVRTQGNGSGADVAASTFGGFIHYSSFQAEWLLNEYANVSAITEMVKKEWVYLSVEPLEIPDQVYFCVGWTGKAASTAQLVNQIKLLKETNPDQFEQFLLHSKKAVQQFFEGMKNSNTALLFNGVKENRRALEELGKNAKSPIVTPQLQRLSDLAEELGGAGKPSGAGGGDCGIAFMPSKEKAEQLLDAWKEAGIKPLEIKPSLKGSSINEKKNK